MIIQEKETQIQKEEGQGKSIKFIKQSNSVVKEVQTLCGKKLGNRCRQRSDKIQSNYKAANWRKTDIEHEKTWIWGLKKTIWQRQGTGAGFEYTGRAHQLMRIWVYGRGGTWWLTYLSMYLTRAHAWLDFVSARSWSWSWLARFWHMKLAPELMRADRSQGEERATPGLRSNHQERSTRHGSSVGLCYPARKFLVSPHYMHNPSNCQCCRSTGFKQVHRYSVSEIIVRIND